MNRIIPAFLLVALAGTAHADISDNGNLSIGGDAVVAGTMSITGTATYSLSVSSGIHVLAGGIKWPDGTETTSGGSSGLLGGNNTWTGTNAFQSSVTIGTDQYTSSATTSAGTLVNGFQIVAASAPTSSTSFSFYQLQPDTLYKLVLWGTQNSVQGVPVITFNDDSGSNYQWDGVQDYFASLNHIGSNSNTASCTFANTGGSIKAGTTFKVSFEFIINSGNTEKVIGSAEMASRGTGGSINSVEQQRVVCMYFGASAPTSLKIADSARTWTAKAYLTQLVTAQ